MKAMSSKEIIVIGLMMFALFLGAGNLIFPPAMGQAAGDNVWVATLGFLITGVGLPVLAIVAIAKSGGDLQTLAKRVHPMFAVFFTLTVYLAIGPFFGIPRTSTVAFEIGLAPFLTEGVLGSNAPLLLYTLFFFGITYWLALNPAKLVGRIGKVLTPILLLLIAVMAIKGFFTPMGSFPSAIETYETSPLFKGFLEGYLTMDTIAALVFGIVVISRISERGVSEKKAIASAAIKAGLIAGIGLSAVYLVLAYLGASSVHTIGYLDNGGAILAAIAAELFGPTGAVMLGLVITFACLTTSIGLVSACGEYFVKLFPTLSYRVVIAVLCLFSLTMANFGLAQLISFSLPILIAIYPVAMVLILLSFIDRAIHANVYVGGIIGAAMVSLVDGFTVAGIHFAFLAELYNHIPLYEEGVGWLIPAIIGALIGFFIKTTKNV